MLASFWNFVAELARGFNPKFDGFIYVFQSVNLSFAVCRAAREFGNFGNKDFVLVVPINDNFVFLFLTVFHKKITRFPWRFRG